MNMFYVKKTAKEDQKINKQAYIIINLSFFGFN